MRLERKKIYRFGFGFALMIFTLWGCSDEAGKTGLALLPTDDLVVVGEVTDTNIQSYTASDEVQRTDESTTNLLGTFNDPIFGKTIADFACQYRLSGYPEFSTIDQIDSMVLYLGYKEIYGDTLTAQHFKVYELDSDIPFDDKFYQNVDLKGLAKSEVLAEKYYIPKFRLDSLTNKYGSTSKIPKDTVTQEIAFKFNSSFINKLATVDSLTKSSNDNFIQFFKGLYIEASDLSQEGTLMKIMGSGIIAYYHKENDTTKYTFTYKNNTSASRVSRFVHDYSNAKFAAHINSEQVQDTLIYAQTMGGIRSKIYIPDLGIWSKLIPEYKDNPDTTHLTINKAELIIKLDTTFSQPKDFRPSEQLVLAAIDSLGKTYLPSDHTYSSAYYGGTYNIIDRTYRFNIAQHIQDIINKKDGKKNYGFYLETAYKNSTSRRVVLKGATSKTGIRLEVTYSKIK